MSPQDAQAFIRAQSFWYHRMYLGNGQYTMPHPVHADAVWASVRNLLPEDLGGASVLDLGCNAGFFSLRAKLRNAGRVLGVEAWDLAVAQAEVIKRVWDLDIEYRQLDAHELASIDEAFDLVIFCGLLYHLENPLQVIRQIGRLSRDAVIVETEVIPDDPANRLTVRQGGLGKLRLTPTTKGFMKFIEGNELNGDGSNWWVPDLECVLGMLRTAGFRYFSTPSYPLEGRLLLAASKHASSLVRLA